MMNRPLILASLGLILAILATQQPQMTSASPMPMKFMCDMCESTWIHCLLHCNMEEYMTRHDYRNKVYSGHPAVKPKKNHLDIMMEGMMKSTGHDHL